MQIYILSSGRAERQITWDSLPKSIREQVKIVVPYDEAPVYRGFPVLTDPEIVRDVTRTRQWLIDRCPDYICMLDDDITFAHRREDKLTNFRPVDSVEVNKLFTEIERCLQSYPHVGVATREGGHWNTEPYKYVGRMVRILSYDCRVLREHDVRIDRLKFMSDFDVTLQLLRRGIPNVIINWMVQNQAGSNASGGCSQYRTREMQEADALKIKELHPEFVGLVKKNTKGKGEWATRTDVVVQWGKAYDRADLRVRGTEKCADSVGHTLREEASPVNTPPSDD